MLSQVNSTVMPGKFSSLQKCILLIAISLAFWWHAVITTFTLALNNDEYTHILLILPVSVALILLEWKSLNPATAPAPRLGVVLLGGALLTACLNKWAMPGLPSDIHLSLSMIALVTWWLGAFVFSFGIQRSLQLMFPLLFLFCLVPLPQFALNRIVVLLQVQSAYATRFLFAATGVPVMQNGMFISIPGVTVEVARECSSIRSSLMLLMTTMVLAHLFLRSFWRKTALILAAIPLSVVKNAIRIYTLSMLGVHVDLGFLHGRLHERGGIVFFILALLIILLLLWLLGRSEQAIPRSDRLVSGRS